MFLSHKRPLLKAFNMATLSRIYSLSKVKKCFNYPNLQCLRLISTSKKNSDSTSTVNPASVTETDACKPTSKKYFYSYGFGEKTEEAENNAMHATFFFSVSLCLIGTAFVLCYQPDYLLRDWSQREAFLELRRREKLGLPLIDPNYINPATMVLPSDEELGDTEIII